MVKEHSKEKEENRSSPNAKKLLRTASILKSHKTAGKNDQSTILNETTGAKNRVKFAPENN